MPPSASAPAAATPSPIKRRLENLRENHKKKMKSPTKLRGVRFTKFKLAGEFNCVGFCVEGTVQPHVYTQM